jgi:colicin import membrane protein
LAQGSAQAYLVQSEIDALRARISSCWTPPPGIDANSKVYIVLRVLFKPDGSISPLSEVKRTSVGSSGMSAFDPKRT